MKGLGKHWLKWAAYRDKGDRDSTAYRDKRDRDSIQG